MIQEIRKRAGLTQGQFAERVGSDQTTISKIERGLRPIPKGLAVAISDEFGVPLERLLGGRSTSGSKSNGTAQRSLERPSLLGEDVPVLGHGRGGLEGFFFDNGSIVDRVERPASLRNVPDAYAVYMHGHSQEPRIRNGELCYVHPHQPPTSGDDVVVQLQDDQGYIKTYERIGGGLLICSQYNPAQKVSWPIDQVKAVHRIVWIARTIR